MCEYPGRSCRRGKKSVVTTNCKKSAEAIVPGEKKNSGRAEQSLVLSRLQEGGQHEESRILQRCKLPTEE